MRKSKNKNIAKISNSLLFNNSKLSKLEILKQKESDLLRKIEIHKKNIYELAKIEFLFKKHKTTENLIINKDYSLLKKEINKFDLNTSQTKLDKIKKDISLEKTRQVEKDKKIEELHKLREESKNKQKKEILNFKKNDIISKTITLTTEKSNSKTQKRKKKYNSPKKKISNSPIVFQPIITEELNFEADWNNVFFEDGYITIKYNKKYFTIHNVPNSKKYLNKISNFYTFHKVPKLKVIISFKLSKIQNIEVLFYHIAFLSTTASIFDFDDIEPFSFSHWALYTKKYYNDYLPFLFNTETLKKICEYCNSTIPIVPVGEVVIYPNGTKKIHQSFLFPLTNKKFIVWESSEEPKASYIFKTTADTIESRFQLLFNFISSEMHNKRLTLLKKPLWQKKLGYEDRIFHTNLSEWDNKIKVLLR